ncbi:MAG: AAA family ATPase [Candidatus Woesearchaeota archaeon]
MILKKLKLKNIRSFESLTINFNQGITLLSGDIGSGKTTILMAIEFALFGILRGKTSPSEILRNGEEEAYVNLEFDINENNVSITRFLKKSTSGINQLPGTIIINGISEELVATELKSKVLELLGYPSSLINKSTNLFRYTVYTPQEQVKLILFESEEERKDIIRKIFALDKYKNIISNINPYQTYLRSEIEKNTGRLEDLQTLKEQKVVKENEIFNLNNSFKKIEEDLLQILEIKNKLKQTLENLEKQQKEFLQQKQKIELSNQNIKNIETTILMLKKQKQQLEEKLNKIELKEIIFDKTKKLELENKIKELEEKNLKYSQMQGEINAKKSNINELIESITNLDKCPTCRQTVTEEHKSKMNEIQNQSQSKLDEKEKKLEELKNKLIIELNQEKIKLKELLNQEKIYENYLSTNKLIKSYQEQINLSVNNIDKHEELLKIEIEKKSNLEKNTIKEINIDKEQKEFQDLLLKERKIELEKQSIQTRLEVSEKLLNEIIKEISEKEQLKKTNENLSKIKNWINDLFIPLMSVIERKIMLKVYQEFNSLFQNWFAILIDDNSIQVKLDENFTPIIEQNGFNTNLENLSGGEKTSVALAYRLALNKVLNDYFSKINTKDLLILDEPTDGFSTEQLDKLNLVLNEVKAKQIIIVSHEQKLESLSQNLVRVEKNNHTSKISNQ